MNNEVETNVVEELEKVRKKAVLIVVISVIIALIIDVILTKCANFNATVCIFILIFIPYLVSIPSRRKFNNLYKDKIVLQCFKSKFTDVEYRPDDGISEATLRDTEMMYTGDRYTSSDYVKAKYKNISFESSDVEIEEESTDSDGHTTYTTIFKGQWYIFDFNKKFKSDIEVCERGFNGALRGNFFSKKTKFKKVELEDIDFNKRFRVYAREEVEAFYILTPSTMVKIKELNDKVKGRILLCFVDNKLHVGLASGKDLYQHSIFKKIDLEKCNKKVLMELNTIIEFVEVLDLDNTLFKSNV